MIVASPMIAATTISNWSVAANTCDCELVAVIKPLVRASVTLMGES
jgi:hypothetical protein